MGKRKLPELTNEEFAVPLLSDAIEAHIVLAEVAKALYKQIDDGTTIEERQETIRLANRARRIWKDASNLSDTLRYRHAKKTQMKEAMKHHG